MFHEVGKQVGQQPSEAPRNGRVTAIRSAQEEAVVMIIDVKADWAAG